MIISVSRYRAVSLNCHDTFLVVMLVLCMQHYPSGQPNGLHEVISCKRSLQYIYMLRVLKNKNMHKTSIALFLRANFIVIPVNNVVAEYKKKTFILNTSSLSRKKKHKNTPKKKTENSLLQARE